MKKAHPRQIGRCFRALLFFFPHHFFNHSRTQRLISRRGPSAPSRPSWAPPELYRRQTAPTPAKPQLCLPCPCFSHTTHCSTTASLELPPNSRLRTTQGLLHCPIHTSPRAQQRHFVLVHVWLLQEQSRRLARHGGLLHSEGVKGSLQCTACSLTVDADAWKSWPKLSSHTAKGSTDTTRLRSHTRGKAAAVQGHQNETLQVTPCVVFSEEKRVPTPQNTWQLTALTLSTGKLRL